MKHQERIAYRKTLSLIILILMIPVLSVAQSLERLTPEQQAEKLKVAKTHRLSGTVTMLADNRPVAKAGINIISRAAINGRPLMKMTVTDADGRWTIDGLPNARYSIIVSAGRTLPPTGASDERTDEPIVGFVTQNNPLEIDGADIEDIVFQVKKGGRIAGVVVMDDGSPLPANLVVLPKQTVTGDRAPIKMAQVQPDGSFVLENVPSSEIMLKAVVFDQPNEYLMKSATTGAIDLLREGIRVADGAEIKDMRIVFAKATAK